MRDRPRSDLQRYQQVLATQVVRAPVIRAIKAWQMVLESTEPPEIQGFAASPIVFGTDRLLEFCDFVIRSNRDLRAGPRVYPWVRGSDLAVRPAGLSDGFL